MNNIYPKHFRCPVISPVLESQKVTWNIWHFKIQKICLSFEDIQDIIIIAHMFILCDHFSYLRYSCCLMLYLRAQFYPFIRTSSTELKAHISFHQNLGRQMSSPFSRSASNTWLISIVIQSHIMHKYIWAKKS